MSRPEKRTVVRGKVKRDPRTPTLAADARHLTRRVLRALRRTLTPPRARTVTAPMTRPCPLCDAPRGHPPSPDWYATALATPFEVLGLVLAVRFADHLWSNPIAPTTQEVP